MLAIEWVKQVVPSGGGWLFLAAGFFLIGVSTLIMEYWDRLEGEAHKSPDVNAAGEGAAISLVIKGEEKRAARRDNFDFP